MTHILNGLRPTLLGAAVLLMVMSPALGATKVFDFVDPVIYGDPSPNCVTVTPSPPLFNRPEYGTQTKDYIWGDYTNAKYCAGGCGTNPSSSDSFLTSAFSHGNANSNEIRFTWATPTNDDSWLRLTAFEYKITTPVELTVTPWNQSPTVYLGIGGRISMDVMVFGTAANEDINCNPFGPADAALEFSLWIRETGRNLPLGMNGGIAGPVECVGVDSAGGAVDTGTPIGGISIANDGLWHLIVWEFIDAGGGAVGVQVTVDGGAPIVKSIDTISGDGILAAANNRGTLDSLAIRKKPGDSTTTKWFLNIDNVVIDAPGVTDPVYIQGPVSDLHTQVVLKYIDPTATEVRLYKDTGSGPTLFMSATSLEEDFSDTEHAFSFAQGSIAEGDKLTATQVVGDVESAPSDTVDVLGGLPIEDFSVNPAEGACATPADADTKWIEVRSDCYAEVRTEMLDGSVCMWNYDGGFRNGLYRRYKARIPAAGEYHMTVLMHITEDSAQLNSIRQYQMGVVALNSSAPLPRSQPCATGLNAVDSTQPNQAVGKYLGLTSANDSGLPTQKITTDVFTAGEGDDILVVFSTNVEARMQDPFSGAWLAEGTWNEYIANDPKCPNYPAAWTTSATWGGNARVKIDNIILKPGPPPNCNLTSAVTVPGPLYATQTTVTVTNVALNASEVRVYKAGYTQIGRKELPTGSATGTEVVDVTALVQGNIISATQTVNGIEACQTVIGPTVGAACGVTPAVTIQRPLLANQTVVTVTDVSMTATAVRVYDTTAGGPPIGENTAPGGQTTVDVTVTPLVTGHRIKARQIVNEIEGCVPSNASSPLVDDCSQIGAIDVVGPVNAGATTVAVSSVLDGATAVTVYANGAQIGQKTAGVVPGDNNVTVTTPLVKGQIISATQTITTAWGSLPGCIPATDEMVGSGHNAQILLSLGIRETNSTGPIGSNGGNSGTIEWLVGATTTPGGPPIGKPLVPGPQWQTVIFTPGVDLVGDFTGDGNLTSTTGKGVMEELAITIDQTAPDVGPYTMYIDNITSAGVNFADFESFTGTGNVQAVFRQPTFSGSTSANLATTPNLSWVDRAVGDGGGQSERIEWRFIDEAASRWIRLTTDGAPNIPNPIVDITQPITMRVLLLGPDDPLPVNCGNPRVDVDRDGDVDQTDFAEFERCYSGENVGYSESICWCFDVLGDGDVDSDDAGLFEACASGAGIAADPACDGI